MKFIRIAGLFLAGVLAINIAGAQDKMAGEKTVMVGGAAMYPAKNIIENAVNSKDHTTLVAAVKAAGLVETLQSAGPFTVFAPTNEAFNKLPKGTVDNLVKPENKTTLTKILTYHVVPGKMDAVAIAALTRAGYVVFNPAPPLIERGPMLFGGTTPLLTIVVNETPPFVLFSQMYVVFRFCCPRRILKNVVGSWLICENVKRYVMSSVAVPSAPADVLFFIWIS